MFYNLSARTPHRTPPLPFRLKVVSNFMAQKIVAISKIECHQNSFEKWRVTEAVLSKTCLKLHGKPH